MRTLRIRKFTVLSLALILSLPWLFFVGAHLIEAKTLRFGPSESQQKNLSGTMRYIEVNTENWANPAWQNRLRSRLAHTNIGAAILSSTDKEIFRSARAQALRSTHEFSVVQDGKLVGRVILYLPNSNRVLMAATFAGLLLAFIIVGFEMRKTILRPLERLSQGARQIAKGDLDVQLPASRITEIADVREGFHVMVEGLKASFKKQAELENERRFVIGAVAHDLRTPLFALRGYLEGLEKGVADSPEKMAKYLAVCKEKSEQLDRLVEDLFTFTKTEYLETELNKSTIDLAHILRKTIDSLTPLARDKRLSITANLLSDDCLIMGDAHLLERAMTNLLDNAIRHTPANGNVFIHCERKGARVTFAVRDTGPGFTVEELQHVFEPLYRGEISRNRSTGGAGLGLTISQRIIRRHGGELTAGNHSDGGALLTGWMPVANA